MGAFDNIISIGDKEKSTKTTEELLGLSGNSKESKDVVVTQLSDNEIKEGKINNIKLNGYSSDFLSDSNFKKLESLKDKRGIDYIQDRNLIVLEFESKYDLYISKVIGKDSTKKVSKTQSDNTNTSIDINKGLLNNVGDAIGLKEEEDTHSIEVEEEIKNEPIYETRETLTIQEKFDEYIKYLEFKNINSGQKKLLIGHINNFKELLKINPYLKNNSVILKQIENIGKNILLLTKGKKLELGNKILNEYTKVRKNIVNKAISDSKEVGIPNKILKIGDNNNVRRTAAKNPIFDRMQEDLSILGNKNNILKYGKNLNIENPLTDLKLNDIKKLLNEELEKSHIKEYEELYNIEGKNAVIKKILEILGLKTNNNILDKLENSFYSLQNQLSYDKSNICLKINGENKYFFEINNTKYFFDTIEERNLNLVGNMLFIKGLVEQPKDTLSKGLTGLFELSKFLANFATLGQFDLGIIEKESYEGYIIAFLAAVNMSINSFNLLKRNRYVSLDKNIYEEYKDANNERKLEMEKENKILKEIVLREKILDGLIKTSVSEREKTDWTNFKKKYLLIKNNGLNNYFDHLLVKYHELQTLKYTPIIKTIQVINLFKNRTVLGIGTSLISSKLGFSANVIQRVYAKFLGKKSINAFSNKEYVKQIEKDLEKKLEKVEPLEKIKNLKTPLIEKFLNEKIIEGKNLKQWIENIERVQTLLNTTDSKLKTIVEVIILESLKSASDKGEILDRRFNQELEAELKNVEEILEAKNGKNIIEMIKKGLYIEGDKIIESLKINIELLGRIDFILKYELFEKIESKNLKPLLEVIRNYDKLEEIKEIKKDGNIIIEGKTLEEVKEEFNLEQKINELTSDSINHSNSEVNKAIESYELEKSKLPKEKTTTTKIKTIKNELKWYETINKRIKTFSNLYDRAILQALVSNNLELAQELSGEKNEKLKEPKKINTDGLEEALKNRVLGKKLYSEKYLNSILNTKLKINGLEIELEKLITKLSIKDKVEILKLKKEFGEEKAKEALEEKLKEIKNLKKIK